MSILRLSNRSSQLSLPSPPRWLRSNGGHGVGAEYSNSQPPHPLYLGLICTRPWRTLSSEAGTRSQDQRPLLSPPAPSPAPSNGHIFQGYPSSGCAPQSISSFGLRDIGGPEQQDGPISPKSLRGVAGLPTKLYQIRRMAMSSDHHRKFTDSLSDLESRVQRG